MIDISMHIAVSSIEKALVARGTPCLQRNSMSTPEFLHLQEIA